MSYADSKPFGKGQPLPMADDFIEAYNVTGIRPANLEFYFKDDQGRHCGCPMLVLTARHAKLDGETYEQAAERIDRTRVRWSSATSMARLIGLPPDFCEGVVEGTDGGSKPEFYSRSELTLRGWEVGQEVRKRYPEWMK